ncbi:lysoplasmalogenase [Candidatus Amarolinea aalborgensis]|jgi:uncharacterized membrane protein YhhN|uniref:lysoplasmalogenase n=1 Tax=Candidatus Amarolinea aalborgensis TaxID=2249329 RepID=UPI003BF97A0F
MTFPVAGPLRTWLLALLALWALLLFGGFIFGQPDAAQSQRIPTWMRMASSAVLVVAAWSWWLAGVQDKGMALLIAVGMSLGFLGDLFMAGLLPASPRVLWGMGAFGLGHVAYIAAFMRLANVLGLTANGPRLAAWLAWLLIGAVGWYLVVFRGQQATALHWAALPYALLLASTAGLASGLALQARTFIPLALGGALFLTSDLILAAQLFNGLSFPLIGSVIWLTYGPAQALIVAISQNRP